MKRESSGAVMTWFRDPLLIVEGLTMRFGGLTAVRDLWFTAWRGEITALIGPNGAGKTTVFNCITGFYRAASGRIILRAGPDSGQSEIARLTASGRRFLGEGAGGVFLLERMPGSEIAAKARVARTFQNIRLFPGMTALENLVVAQHNDLMPASGWSFLGLAGAASWRAAERAAVDRARSWLDRIGLLARADDAAGQLPYGDQRRLEIARAMCTRPVLLCLDEPAAGLNPRESAELADLLHSIKAQDKTSILLIEHDMSVVMDISDQIIVLEHGIQIAAGPPARIKNDPRVIAAYLGVGDEEDVSCIEARAGA